MKYIGLNEEGPFSATRKMNRDELSFKCANLEFSRDDKIFDKQNNHVYVETEYAEKSQLEHVTELIKSAYYLIQNQNSN